MELHAAAARARLGELLGGDEGEKLLRSAHHRMQEEGVVAPEKFARLLVPDVNR
jgi:hypothetical protein